MKIILEVMVQVVMDLVQVEEFNNSNNNIKYKTIIEFLKMLTVVVVMEVMVQVEAEVY
jgi:hypothetical protein